MKKNISTLLLSSILTAVPAMAAQIANQDVRLSDGHNGIITKTLQPNTPNFKTWQDNVLNKYEKRHEELGNTVDQLERFFAPLTRKGTDQIRTIANGLIDYYTLKLNVIGLGHEQFDGHKGNLDQKHKDTITNGLLPRIGRHARILAEMEKLQNVLSEVQAFKTNYPDLMTKFDEELKKLNLDILQELQELNRINAQIELKNGVIENQKKLIDQSRAGSFSMQEGADTCINNIANILEEQKNLKGQIDLLQKELDQKETVTTEEEKTSSDEAVVLETTQQRDATSETIQGLQLRLQELEGKIVTLRSEEADWNSQKEEQGKEAAAAEKTLEELVDDLTDLEVQKDKFERVLKTLEGQSNDTTQQIQNHGEQAKEFESKIAGLKVQIQQVQDKADAYALVKYITTLNNYAGIPTDENNLHGYEDGINILSPEQERYIRKLMNERSSQISKESVKTAVDREVERFSKVVDTAQVNHEKKDKENLKKHMDLVAPFFIQNIKQNTSSANQESTLISNFNDLVLKISTTPHTRGEIVTNYNKDNATKYQHWTYKLDQEKFQALIKPENRADRLIKKSMADWKGKISTAQNSLVHELGLDCGLFNQGYDNKFHPYMISFKHLEADFGKDILEETLKIIGEETAKTGVWPIALMQLKTNFFNDFAYGNADVTPRVIPIYDFVEAKLARQKDKNGKAHVVIGDDQGQTGDKYQRCFLKFVSYASMTYGLTHDVNGQKLPPLKRIDPALEALNVMLSPNVCIDAVLGAKAYKWGHRLFQLGESFTEKDDGPEAVVGFETLKAWIFDGVSA